MARSPDHAITTPFVVATRQKCNPSQSAEFRWQPHADIAISEVSDAAGRNVGSHR